VTAAERVSATRITDQVELLTAQLRGLDLWHVARRAAEQSARKPGSGREARLDVARRLDVRRREHQAIVERLALGLDTDAGPMVVAVPARVVIAHRHVWSRNSLTAELTKRGVEVLCALDNGADAVGVCVAEQPAFLIVDELLAMRSGREVVAEVTQFCPRTFVAGYVRDEAAVGDLLEAGATTVFTRRVTPADLAESLDAAARRLGQ
jgi:hypothetical protein